MGDVSKVVNVPIHDDTIFENAETVNLALNSIATAPGTTPGTPLTAVLTINPDGDAAPVLNVSDATFAGDSLGGACTNAFEVTLVGATQVYPVTVHYQTSNDTAFAGQDYTATNGTLTFNNSSPQCVPVTIINDPVQEPTEQFFIDLDTPTNASIGDGRGIGTIPSGDPAPSFLISDATPVFETNGGTTTATFTITKIGSTTLDSTVHIATQDGTATTASSDYVLKSVDVPFTASQVTATVTITINGDTAFEPDETFDVLLTSVSNAAILDDTGIGTILNDDCTPPPSGMVAWYSAENNANDSVGGNNGVLQNGAVANAPGKVGQAFSFNGTDQFVQVPDSPSLRPTAVSIDAWVNTNNPSQSGGIVGKSLATGNWNSYLFAVGSGTLGFQVNNRTETKYGAWSVNFVPTAGTWYHVAATWQNVNGNATDAKIYINGVEQSTSFVNQNYDTSFVMEYNTQPLYIGRLESGNYFPGLVDEVEIFNRVLTAGEVANLATASGGGKCQTPIVQFARSAEMEDESQTAAVIVNRSVSTSGLTDVTAATVAGGTATGGAACTAGVDYKTTSQLLSFGNGDAEQTMSIEICPDLDYETPQTIKLQLSGPSGAAVLGGNSAIFLTINDAATQFTNNHDPINIPAFGATASPYPSTINVSGAPTVNGGMRVTLYDVELQNPDNLDILLVGPLGQKMVIMGDAGGSTPMTGPVTLTFDDSATQVLPNSTPFATGKYEPTTWEPVIAAFPAPAPVFPYVVPGSALGGPPSLGSAFGSGNPNGQWRLFVRDDAGAAFTEAGQPGAIAGGWGLQFLVPTASGVSVSGRVTTAEGRGIRGAIVTVTGNSLPSPINVITGVNGRYNIDGLTAGETYIVTIRSRRFVFSNPSRIVTLNDNVNDADFIADTGTTRDDH